jgi:hypothetical protein
VKRITLKQLHQRNQRERRLKQNGSQKARRRLKNLMKRYDWFLVK